MDKMREFIKEQKKKYRYLDVRLKVYLVSLCVIAMFLVLCLDRSWIFPEWFWKMVLVFVPLVMLGIGYLWIGKPYKRILNQVERFSDGYITLRSGHYDRSGTGADGASYE